VSKVANKQARAKDNVKDKKQEQGKQGQSHKTKNNTQNSKPVNSEGLEAHGRAGNDNEESAESTKKRKVR
jgi:hypothetical protein